MKLNSINDFLNNIEQNNLELIQHYERVGMLNYAFGKELELKNSERDKLYVIGLLHEIGKYNDNDDYPLISALILKTHKEFANIADIVSQCKENIDGSGFPNHLLGDDIHLFAMITNLNDSYDHFRMESLSHNEAITKLRKYNNIICPKKMITSFIKMMFANKELLKLYEEDEDDEVKI